MDPVSKAQSGDNTGKNKRRGRIENLRPRWKPGESGNPKGRPKKKYITKIYERILRNSKNRKEIEQSFMEILTGGRMASVLMAREMAERTEGKIAQEVDVDLHATVHYADVIARIRARKNKLEPD